MNCKECSGILNNKNDGYIVCIECGTISDIDISDSPEWDDGYGPCVEDNLCPYVNISTFTQKGSKSYITKNGVLVSHDIYNLHVQCSYNSKQRSYDNIESIIDNCNELGHKIKEIAKKKWLIFMKTEKIKRGANRIGLVACCIYYSCKENSSPRTPAEICSFLGIELKSFNKGNKIYNEIFKDVLDQNENIIAQYLKRYCSKLSLENTSKSCSDYRKCMSILEKIGPYNLEPKSIACGILFVALDLKKSFIVKEFEISYPTLNKSITFINKIK